MKHIPMGRRKRLSRPAGLAADPAGRLQKLLPTPAIDLFIDRSLHALYDAMLEEPIPDDLLRLIEDDRNK